MLMNIDEFQYQHKIQLLWEDAWHPITFCDLRKK